MKKIFIFIQILLLYLIWSTKPAEAHFLATDGNIGAVLHVEPNDQPIAGSQASFLFEFKDKTNTFKPANCDCTFEINKNGNTIFSQPLFQNNSNPSLSNASVFYTFLQKDVYEVTVVGKPVTPNAFQPFTLTWNFRVDQQSDQSGQTTQFFLPVMIAVFPVLCIIMYFWIKGERRGKEKNDEKNIGNMY